MRYRIWNKRNREMYSPEELAEMFLYVDGIGRIVDASANRHEFREDCVAMLSTGLKDKNGVEIFEGDVLKHDLWGSSQIIWEHGMFRGTGNDHDVTLADHQLQRSRITGNIFQQP